ncbi:uncharacterized protein LOC144155666 [Haemaphysalis longicornis]
MRHVFWHHHYHHQADQATLLERTPALSHPGQGLTSPQAYRHEFEVVILEGDPAATHRRRFRSAERDPAGMPVALATRNCPQDTTVSNWDINDCDVSVHLIRELFRERTRSVFWYDTRAVTSRQRLHDVIREAREQPDFARIEQADKYNQSFRDLQFSVADLVLLPTHPTTILEVPIKAAGDTLDTGMLDETERKELSAEQSGKTASTLNRPLPKTSGRRSTELVNIYCRSMWDLATHANNAALLMRCRAMRIVPRRYRVKCDAIKNTRQVDRILDECSYRLMLADLDYSRLRKTQLSRFLERLHEQLKAILPTEELNSVVVMAEAIYENIFEATWNKQRAMFAELVKEYELEPNKNED